MNPWKILGVNRQSTKEEVHAAYIKLARQHHPDINDGDAQHMSVVTGAYQLLKSLDETRKFLNQLRAVGTECADCKGKGAVFKQRGMTERIAITCIPCEGMGIIRKEKVK